MFTKRVELCRLLGFKIQIDISWIFLAVLVAWSLAQGFFPALYEGLPHPIHWWMGIAGALGLFLSLIFHELSHSIVARRYGLPIRGITLFIFGGAAEMEDEPPGPKAEFLMAIAGPISSVLLASGFHSLAVVGSGQGLPIPVVGVCRYLAFINVLLAGFNLVPAFPLDGGRILRALLWRWKGNLRWSTRIASRLGAAFGIGLIVLGLFNAFAGNIVGGMWFFLIGMFLRAAAEASYQQLLTRQIFEGEPVRRFMTLGPVTVEPWTSLRDLVEDYVYEHHFDLFPVTDGDRLLGCVNVRQVKQVPRDQWESRQVSDIYMPCSGENRIDADSDAVKALSLMRRTGTSRLMVTEGERLVGVITLKDMLKLLALKIDLEEFE